MKQLFDKVSHSAAVTTTKEYSTSFSLAVKLLSPSIRQAIYNIYGFVRVADEIVDSFTDYPQEELFNKFELDYKDALSKGISTNPILNAFQESVKEYDLDLAQIEAFMKSMRADLTKQKYTTDEEIKEYIYGSADVVGLMCLKVFVKGDCKEYDRLKDSAMKLGSAFQKVNFLRDLNHDYSELNRTYFPNINPQELTEEDKKIVIADIDKEYKIALEGIKKLPKEAKLGVYVAYNYYSRLLKNIKKTPAKVLMKKRIRVSNSVKVLILIKSYVFYNLRLF